MRILSFLILMFLVGCSTSVPPSAPADTTHYPQIMMTTTSNKVTLTTQRGSIEGTLIYPQSNSPVPLFIIIAGSGPTDRDGNNVAGLQTNAYKMLADELAKLGIASIRYDKQGVGASKSAFKSEAELSFDDYVDDAVGWIQQYQNDARFSKIGVAGHSEGSLIGMLAVAYTHADFFVSIAGAGRPIDQVLVEQLTPKVSSAVMMQVQWVLAELKAGRAVPQVPPTDLLFRPSVQPFLMSELRYNPAQELARLTCPVLIVQGDADLQVAVKDAQLLHAAKPDARYLIVHSMNHVLKLVMDEQDNQKAYNDPTRALAPELVPEIKKFLLSN